MRALLPFLLLSACIVDGGGDEDVDTDGDGLTDSREADLGTDPSAEDSDEDGLADGQEVDELGTDPLAEDSDGDGYLDPWEVAEGSDPADAESLIYTGGWPYNPNKDQIEDPGFGQKAKEGRTMPRFAWTDQYGEEVDVYDFAGHGKPVVVDLSGAWCYWCQETAKLLEGKRSALGGYGYDDLDVYLEEGDFYWITVLDADVSGRSIDADEVAEWYDEYTNPFIPVLADENMELTAWFDPVGYPSILLLDENMEVTVYDENNYTAVFDELNNQFAGE